MLIDSHAHLTAESTAPHAKEIVERAVAANVHKIINICTDVKALEKGIALSQQFPSVVYNVASTTPHDVKKEGALVFDTIASYAKQKKLVAVGETGLDYYYEHSDRELQKYFLTKYLHLALETGLPVVIHCRDAFADLFSVLDQEYCVAGKYGPGVLHCFTGNMEEAQQVLARGFYLSLSGIVTFKKSIELQQIAKMIPIDQLLIETDTPFLAPQSRRGKSNEPAFLLETAQMIATLKNIELSSLAEATTQNTYRLFKL